MTKDNVMRPSYYEDESGEDLIDYMTGGLMSEQETRGFLKGNAYKYLMRYKRKGDQISDLEKAKEYINRLEQFEDNIEADDSMEDE